MAIKCFLCIEDDTPDQNIKLLVSLQGIISLINAFCMILQIITNSLFIRYLEWTLTSPLMILQICIATNVQSVKSISIVSLTVSFCLCGSIAAITDIFWLKILLGAKGSIYCISTLYLLWSHMFSLNDIVNINKIAYLNLVSATLLWPFFVSTWALGPDVCKILSFENELLIENTMSLILKTIAFLYTLNNIPSAVRTVGYAYERLSVLRV